MEYKFVLKVLIIGFVCITLLSHTECLRCYLCPVTVSGTQEDANINCLALGYELNCSPDQDRCFSEQVTDTSVRKGCTNSRECLQNTACCGQDFCNANPQQAQTGYGKICQDLSGCVQDSEVMRCERELAIDTFKKCLCTEMSYTVGAICRKKSYPGGVCSTDDHCLASNSSCESRQCVCDRGLYANDTICQQQKGLGEPCEFDKECLGENTVCSGVSCVCKFGYLRINGTDDCSGERGNFYATKLHGISVFLAAYTGYFARSVFI